MMVNYDYLFNKISMALYFSEIFILILSLHCLLIFLIFSHTSLQGSLLPTLYCIKLSFLSNPNDWPLDLVPVSFHFFIWIPPHPPSPTPLPWAKHVKFDNLLDACVHNSARILTHSLLLLKPNIHKQYNTWFIAWHISQYPVGCIPQLLF